MTLWAFFNMIIYIPIDQKVTRRQRVMNKFVTFQLWSKYGYQVFFVTYKVMKTKSTKLD